MKKKKIFLVSIPDASPAEMKELRDNLRPFARNHNMVLSRTKIEPITLEDYKVALESHLESLKKVQLEYEKDLLEAKKRIEGRTPKQKEALAKASVKADELLKKDPPKVPTLK